MSRQRPHASDCDCFGCKVAGLGFQGLRSRHGSDPTRRHDVIVEEGSRRGRVGGFHTEHWDGRQDATVHPPVVRLKATTTEEM